MFVCCLSLESCEAKKSDFYLYSGNCLDCSWSNYYYFSPQSWVRLCFTLSIFTKDVKQRPQSRKGFYKQTCSHMGNMMQLLWKRWNWMAPKMVATMRGVFWMVRIMRTIEIIHAKYLFLTKNGRKQKFIFSYLFSPVNLKTQIIMSGVQPRLKK